MLLGSEQPTEPGRCQAAASQQTLNRLSVSMLTVELPQSFGIVIAKGGSQAVQQGTATVRGARWRDERGEGWHERRRYHGAMSPPRTFFSGIDVNRVSDQSSYGRRSVDGGSFDVMHIGEDKSEILKFLSKANSSASAFVFEERIFYGRSAIG